MGTTRDPEGGATQPRSMRHKQILEAAAERPDATMKEIAREIPSATTDLVENVIDEYGDPAASDPDESPESIHDTTLESDDNSPECDDNSSDEVDSPDPSTLTDKQLATLRAVHRYPEATQERIGDVLGVSAPTVSNRVNAIDGFDWDRRETIARAVVEASDAAPVEDPPELSPNGGESAEMVTPGGTDESTASSEPVERNDETESNLPNEQRDRGRTGDSTDRSDQAGPDASPDRETPGESTGHAAANGQTPTVGDDERLTAVADRLTAVEDRLSTIEEQLDVPPGTRGRGLVVRDPELVHKVLRSCLRSESITEDEELRLVRALVESDRPN